MWQAILRLINTILSLLRLIPKASPWSVDVLGDLSADSDLDVVKQSGGLSNDGAAAWVEKSLHKPGILVRRVPGRTPERITMYQLSGAQVDLRIGNMNDAHDIAGMAISNPTGSTWGIVIHDQGGQVWLRPSFEGVTVSASGIDGLGYVVGNAPNAAAWETPTSDPVAISGETAEILLVAAVSPNGRHMAGDYRGTDANLRHFPWYRSGDGVAHLDYVENKEAGSAHDINAAQVSCGENRDPVTGLKSAWRFQPVGSKTNWLLGLADGDDVNALSLNKNGVTVGYSGDRAVLWHTWQTGGQYKAADLTAELNDANVVLARALRINDQSDILCFGWRVGANGEKDYKMFLLHAASSRFQLGG